MSFINEMVSNIKNAKTDEQLKCLLYEVYIICQMDSTVRREFDKYFNTREE